MEAPALHRGRKTPTHRWTLQHSPQAEVWRKRADPFQEYVEDALMVEPVEAVIEVVHRRDNQRRDRRREVVRTTLSVTLTYVILLSLAWFAEDAPAAWTGAFAVLTVILFCLFGARRVLGKRSGRS